MRKVLFILAFILSGNLFSQVSLHLMLNGKFLSDDLKEYTIVPLEGMSVDEIRELIIHNASLLYRNPSKVLSVSNNTVSINAYSNYLLQHVGFPEFVYEGYYTILIEIKEGRVKINHPVIDKVTNGTEVITYARAVSYWAYKKANIKEKYKPVVKKVEDDMSAICNNLVSTQKPQEEEW